MWQSTLRVGRGAVGERGRKVGAENTRMDQENTARLVGTLRSSPEVDDLVS